MKPIRNAVAVFLALAAAFMLSACTKAKVLQSAPGPLLYFWNPIWNFLMENWGKLLVAAVVIYWLYKVGCWAHQAQKKEQAEEHGLHKVAVPKKIGADALSPPQFRATITRQIGKIEAATFTLELLAGHGSGFLVTGGGLALTCAHVVDSDEYFDVKGIGSDERKAGKVVRFADDGLDAALIVVAPAKRTKPLRINRAIPKVGDDVYAFGTPLDGSLEGTLTRGVVSAIREEDGIRVIQSDVSILPGNSGGPLLDKWGNVVGISTEIRVMGDGQHTSICRFVPIDEALRRLGFEPAEKSE